MIAYWKIRARLLRVPGVANVAIWGERLRDARSRSTRSCCGARRLARRGDGGHRGRARRRAAAVLRAAASSAPAGSSTRPNQRLGDPARRCRSSTPEDLAQVADRAQRRRPTLAHRRRRRRGRWSHQPLIGDAVINDGPGLLLIVEKLPWANTLEVTTRRRGGASTELQPGLPGHRDRHHDLPAGDFIEIAIDNLTKALLIGCLLVVLVLDRLPLRVADRADQRASRSRCR